MNILLKGTDMYSYDRRASVGNATPGLDAIAKKDLTSKLKGALDKAERAVDRAEALVEKGKATEAAMSTVVELAVKATYEMFNLLRPAMNPRELEAIEDMTIPVAVQAKALIHGLKALDRLYAPLANRAGKDLSPKEAAKALHKLWSQMDLVYQVYRQYRQVY